MRFLRKFFAVTLMMAIVAIVSGCGPAAVALSGGGTGAFFALQGGDDDKKKDDPKPSTPTTNVPPVVVITSVTRMASPSEVKFTLIDANLDPCDIEVDFRIPGDATFGSFQTATSAATGSGKLGLSADGAGVAHTFHWDYFVDFGGPQLRESVELRIRANDGTVNGAWATISGQTVGNDAPSITNVNPVGSSGVFLIEFHAVDATNDLVALKVELSTNSGATFFEVSSGDFVGTGPVNLLSSPTGTPGQFLWDSNKTLPGFVGTVSFKITPKDAPNGFVGEFEGPPAILTGVVVNNDINDPAEFDVLSEYDAITFTGEVPIEFLLWDEESDPTVVGMQYDLWNGSAWNNTWTNCTLENQFGPGAAGPYITTPSPSFYNTKWLAVEDLQSAAKVTARLRVFTENPTLVPPPFVSDSFDVEGNSAPYIFGVTALQNSGNIPVVVEIADDNSNPVDIEIEFSTDGFTWNPILVSEIVAGSLSSASTNPFGEQTVLVWDSGTTFQRLGLTNEAACELRARATDIPPNALPAALTSVWTYSDIFPVITDQGHTDPVLIEISEGTNSVTTLPGGADLTFTGQILPAGAATGRTVYWEIDEGNGGAFGTLSGGGNATGSFDIGTIWTPTSLDGDTLTIDDGFNGIVTFEFDNNSMASTGHTVIDVSTIVTNTDLANAIAAAINASPLLAVSAMTLTGSVQITHGIQSSFGNGPGRLSTTCTSTEISVTPMSGGSAANPVTYTPPAVFPAGFDYFTLRCSVEDYSFFYVSATYRVYFGGEPDHVVMNPSSATLVAGNTIQLGAVVEDSSNTNSPPQIVTWQVLGGGQYGFVDEFGFYWAPTVVPPGGQATVRAVSVNPSVSGSVTLTIQPTPTSVQVTPPNMISDPNITTGPHQFTATVLPSGAPSGILWRVYSNGQDFGPGNPTVGFVDNTGLYTPPNLLPSPNNVQIVAFSAYNPYINGFYNLTLTAPDATSFDLSVELPTHPPTPLSAPYSVTAGGLGIHVKPTNFAPANANPAVVWSLSPFLGTIDSKGLYTPPQTLNTATQIQIIATSVQGTATNSIVVTVQPDSNLVTPTGISVGPTLNAVTTSGGLPIQFNAVVTPANSSQAVTWSVVSGGGSVDSTGLYIPDIAPSDDSVTVRVTSDIAGSVFQDISVCVTGDGYGWNEIDNKFVGRGDASMIYDSYNDFVWIVGGKSELSDADYSGHTLKVMVHDRVANDWSFANDIPFTFGGTGSGANAAPDWIVAVQDGSHNLYALAATRGGPLQMFRLDMTLGISATWADLSTKANSPNATVSGAPMVWYDSVADEVCFLQTKTIMYRFNIVADSWSVWTLGKQATGPQAPTLCSVAFDASVGLPVFTGPTAATGSASHGVWVINAVGNWELLTVSGNAPSTGLRHMSLAYTSGEFVAFGGSSGVFGITRKVGYRFTVSLGSYDSTWTELLPTDSNVPQPREHVASAYDGTNVLLYGGHSTSKGMFGDYWDMNISGTSVSYGSINATNAVPQGRIRPAAAADDGVGFMFGGRCSHGASDELWKYTYDPLLGPEVTWEKIDVVGSNRPSARYDATMVFNANTDTYLMFGGSNNVIVFNETWEYDPSTNQWTELVTSGSVPQARGGAGVWYDEPNDVLWVFGGYDSSDVLQNDLYFLDLSSLTWSQISASGPGPDARRDATIGVSDIDGCMYIAGGTTVAGANNQLFRLDFIIGSASGNWVTQFVGNQGFEQELFESATIFDSECGRFMSNPKGIDACQALVTVTGGPQWQYLTDPQENNKEKATGVYDAEKGVYIALMGEKYFGAGFLKTNAFRAVRLK